MFCNLKTNCLDLRNDEDGGIRIDYLREPFWYLGMKPSEASPHLFIFVAVLHRGATKHPDTGLEDASTPGSR